MEEINESNETKQKKSNKVKIILTIVITLVALLIATFAMYVAQDYQKSETEDMINLIINNRNVTARMKNEVYIDNNGVIYISKDDVQNYFDKYIRYYENEKRLVTTYEDKLATLIGNNKVMEVNGELKDIKSSIITKNDVMYIPFSEMCETVYNAKLTYINKEENRIVLVESKDREIKEATVNKKVNVKYRAKFLSRTLEKLEPNDKVIYIEKLEPNDNVIHILPLSEGWVRIRTQNGKLGYIKESDIAKTEVTREAKIEEKQIEGKVNLVWDYFSEFAKAPDRNGEELEGVNVLAPTFFTLEKGTGHIIENVGEAGVKYINWAHENNYKVWASFASGANSEMKDTISNIISTFEKRKTLIDNIVGLVELYDLDGLNLDFEYMNLSDKGNYSRLVIELAPRLKALGKTFSVDVTAPDGSENWSLCYDRNIIGHVADYIVFMAYDQHGTSSKAGTVAGYNWVETNINKFINQEVVKNEKIILGIPLYTRIWTITEEKSKDPSKTVDIKDVETVISGKGTPIWDDNLKQYYIEYNEGNNTKAMWIEDESSIKEKIGLANKYKLAGIAFWRKDMEPEDFWKTVDEELNKE